MNGEWGKGRARHERRECGMKGENVEAKDKVHVHSHIVMNDSVFHSLPASHISFLLASE